MYPKALLRGLFRLELSSVLHRALSEIGISYDSNGNILSLNRTGEDGSIVIKSWSDNWDRLSKFFQYSEPIRKLIYTTNTVEDYHRQIRKVTKNKGVFPNDTALVKLVYLAYRNARKKWTMPVPNWGIISQQLAIKL